VDANGELQPELESIFDRRIAKNRGRSITELLVHWKGTAPEDDTREKAWKLQAQFQHLLGKVFWEGSLAMGIIFGDASVRAAAVGKKGSSGIKAELLAWRISPTLTWQSGF